MAFDFSSAEILPGHTIPVILDMLPGSPVVHLEHLGLDNRSWMGRQIASAQTEPEKPTPRRVGAKKQTRSIEEIQQSLRDGIEDKRGDLLHSVRKLEAVHTDTGKEATDADIPAFIAAIPRDVVEKLWVIAMNPENYRRAPSASEIKALAEK